MGNAVDQNVTKAAWSIGIPGIEIFEASQFNDRTFEYFCENHCKITEMDAPGNPTDHPKCHLPVSGSVETKMRF